MRHTRPRPRNKRPKPRPQLDISGEILYDTNGDPAWVYCPGCGLELKFEPRANWATCPKCTTQISLEQG